MRKLRNGSHNYVHGCFNPLLYLCMLRLLMDSNKNERERDRGRVMLEWKYVWEQVISNYSYELICIWYEYIQYMNLGKKVIKHLLLRWLTFCVSKILWKRELQAEFLWMNGLSLDVNIFRSFAFSKTMEIQIWRSFYSVYFQA